MDTIVEEDEKEVPLGWWSVDKKGPKIEIQIPLGDANQPTTRGRRHSLNLPRSPLASETSPRPKFVPAVPTVKTKQQLNINASHLNVPGSKSLSATATTQPTSPNALRLHKFLQNNQCGIPEEDIEENSPRGAPLSLAHVPSHRSRDARRNSDGDFTPALPKAVFLREMAEREIIETETAYVKDLNICIEEFLLPMRSKEILAKQEMEDIFINIEAIANIHEELEKDLRAHANIPRTFQKMTPFLRMYSSYCANGTKSLETLIKCKKSPAVEKFLVQCITKESVRGQPLESYLIKPTQRLCKYPLLLQALLSNTESGTTEYKELEQVLDQIKAVVLVVNEKKRQVETLQMIEELKSQIVGGVGELFAKTTVFIKDGSLTVLNYAVVGRTESATSGDAGEVKSGNIVSGELTFYLFDDLLLATKPGKKHKKKLVHAFGLDRLLVKDIVKLDESVPKTTFNLWTYQNDKKMNMRLAAPLEREKLSWLSAFEKATTSKAQALHEMFSKFSFETTKMEVPKQLVLKTGSSSSFEVWYHNRKIRLFGEDIVLKQDQQIQQIIEIRASMQAVADKENAKWDEEDAEEDISKLDSILLAYKNEQALKMQRASELLAKIAALQTPKLSKSK